MTYDCMTEDELSLWRSTVTRRTAPCLDCPLSFRLAETAAGRCCRAPQPKEVRPPRPRMPDTERLRRKREAMRATRMVNRDCTLLGPCKHRDCTAGRARIATNLKTKGLSLREIGIMLGRSKTSVLYLLSTDSPAATRSQPAPSAT